MLPVVASENAPTRLSTWQSIAMMFRSWRLAAVCLQQISSGLPLGLVWIAIPTWLTQAGADIKVVGLFTLAQAPWSFKFVWSPLMDRYPLPFLGRKRGWIFVTQIALLALTIWLAGVSDHPDAVWVIGALSLAMGFAAASQDIAVDAYAVEVLRKEEHGAAVGARTAFYRAAMFISGGLAITLGAQYSWKAVNFGLALVYLPMLLVTARSPEPEVPAQAPRSLRDAVWGPFVGFLAQHRALEILAFVVLYKLSDNLTQALTGPFLVQTGFSAADVGVGRSGMAVAATLVGTFLGGFFTTSLGLGRALWIFGFLQILSNLGYALVAQVGPNRAVMYAAVAFELGASGLGSGAFGVLLLRLTQKRFSATQFALLSSLFSIPRILAGPPAGFLADTLGWRDFFILTLPLGIPGLVMLARFVPWSVREPEFHVADPLTGAPLTRRQIATRSAFWVAAAWGTSLVTMASLEALRSYRAKRGFNFGSQVMAILNPQDLGTWTTFVGILLAAITIGLMAAATLVARRGIQSAHSPATSAEATHEGA